MLYLSTKYADIKNNLIYDVEAGFRIFKKSIINNPLYWEIVHDIDKVSEINGDYIKTPFGGTSSDNLSSGCKALLLAVATGTWVNFLEAGDNSEITRKLSGVSNESLKTMVSALEELDIVNRVNNLAGFVSSDEAEYRSVTDQEICINIPGLLDTLLSVLNTTPDKVSGTENENIILSALCRLKPRVYEVYYLKFQVSGREHEIDAVVQVRDHVSFDIKYILIEVKTDKKDKSEYAQHLISQDLPEVIKQNTSKRIVVYMGENKIKTFGKYKVQYINIVEFLSNIEKYLGI